MKSCFIALVTLVFLLQARSAFLFSYRDEPLSHLTTRVDSGIWKGCYTTPERAEAVIGLEEYIREETDKNDRVFFLDWASFGYLMNEGTACSSQTLDPCGYSYKCDYPRIIYDYYKQTSSVPNIIFYVDFARDENLSIEDESWSFNEFAELFYNRSGTFENEVFRVLKYSLTDEAGAYAFALEKALP